MTSKSSGKISNMAFLNKYEKNGHIKLKDPKAHQLTSQVQVSRSQGQVLFMFLVEGGKGAVIPVPHPTSKILALNFDVT